ncbi:MAG: biotin/lipoyl-containing protein [Ruminococcus sp.]|nr:biotin/lipoyl-containing protein [Ruminococcus sp.]CDE34692.1 biotin/lipoyl attachment domain-containing protein [Ruminococcus sp. CAG:403]
MRRFQVTVNGTAYDVAVEETASDAGSVQPEVALQQEHSTEKQAVPDGTPISAPMTGTILELQVQVGDAVQSGQTVAVLEAMKMANDLVAPENGVIAAILVQKGAQVQSGQPLLILQQEG